MTRRPRVLQVVQRFFPELGGTETHVAEVGRRLAERSDLDLTVLATDRSGRLPRREVKDGYEVLRRRSYPRTSDLYLSPGIVDVIRHGGWDLVHFQGVHTLVPPVGMLSALSARRPYVLSFHSGGHSSPVRTSLRDAQWKALTPLLRRADRLVAVSRFERGHFSRVTGIPADRFAVIGNGGALPDVPADVLPVPGRILTSGRLEEYKGHHLAVAALPDVRRSVPDAHLVVLGTGAYEAELRALADRLGVAAHVQFRALDPAERGAMARELASASVMAALSRYEAHPVAIMEAVTLGLPVVGLDVAGTGDLVEDGLVRGLAPDAGTATVAAALTEELQRVGARGPRPHTPTAVALPTWESSAEALAGVYADVLRARR